LIREYATQVRGKILEAQRLQKELDEMKKAEEELRLRAEERRKTEESYSMAERDYGEAKSSIDYEKRLAETELSQRIARENEASIEERKRVEATTNAVEIAKNQVRQYLVNSEYITINPDGEMGFNDDVLVKKLEDIFLDDVLDEIAKEDGQGGFFGKVKCDYTGLIAYWDRMESLSEIPRIDWIRSAILSRTKGYRTPQFPYLMTGKPEGQIKAKGSLDTAIIIDRSGSMNHNNRMEAARKTGLATTALMRRLNPRNRTYLAYYDDFLKETTTKN